MYPIPMTAHSAYIPTLEGDEAEEFIRKADENVRLMRQRLCKNHVWRKDYLNGGKKCQVCGKAKETPTRNKGKEWQTIDKVTDQLLNNRNGRHQKMLNLRLTKPT
jgi:hypothetical protein